MFAKLVSLLLFTVTNVCVSQNVTESGKKFEGFIVGGKETSINAFPHAAYLGIQCNLIKVRQGKSVQNVGCGSSIVNQVILVTAAHCLSDCLPSSKIRVKVGTENIQKGSTYHSERFLVHQAYDSKTMANDIALIKLSEPLRLGKSVKRVVMLKSTPNVWTAYVSGWGLVDEDKMLGTIFLKQAAQTIMNRNTCLGVLPNLPLGTFCGKGARSSGFAAQGDSGSGLIMDEYIIIGLVSYKYPDFQNEVAVYTEVSYFYDWIMRTSRSLYCGK